LLINPYWEDISRENFDHTTAAVALGRLGRLVGGHTRAKKLSSKRRKEIALKAVKFRWKNK